MLTLFVRLSAHLRAQGSPQLRQYLASLETFIRGAQDWGISSRRYTTPDDPADLPSAFCDTATDTSQEPLDIPAITWWWDVLPRDEDAIRLEAGRLSELYTGTGSTARPARRSTLRSALRSA